MRRSTLLSLFVSSASVVGSLVLHACGSFEPADAGAAGGDASSDASDASACPSLQPFCDGAVDITCPGLPDRCFSFCPERSTHDIAAGTCAAWGGCLAGISTAMHLSCLRKITAQEGAQVFVDLVQDASSTTRTDGWGAACSGAPQPAQIPWDTNEPNDGSDSGVETGREQCAEILSRGALVDTPCLGQYELVCERAR